jgi:hypothetical protein
MMRTRRITGMVGATRAVAGVLVGLVLVLVARGGLARGCDSCAMPGVVLAAPTPTCQLVSGATDNSCRADFFALDLVAGRTYAIGFCGCGGWADFDALLRVWSPSCALVAEDDASCGTFPHINTLTPTTTGRHVLELTGSRRGDTGSYYFHYQQLCPPTAYCYGTQIPQALKTCQLVSGTLVDGCPTSQEVYLETGQSVTFTLCDATCPGASAPPGARLEVLSSAGGEVVTSDACGPETEVVVRTSLPPHEGDYCVRVLPDDVEGDFVLGWRFTCQAPSGLALWPAWSATGADACGAEQDFAITWAGSGTFTTTWEITPPPGASATPTAGTITSSANTAWLTAALAGDGAYEVVVTVENECGATTALLTHVVLDLQAPDLTLSAVPAACAGGLMGAPVEGDHLALATALSGRPAVVPTGIDGGDRGELDLPEAPGLDPARRRPGLDLPPEPAALSCATPCTSGILEIDHPFYELYVDCPTGSYTARTGSGHPITLDAGAPQSVIYCAPTPQPYGSDAAWFVHELLRTFQDTPGGQACAFDPPDTPAEPDSLGIEVEWIVEPEPNLKLLLREEVVTFGTTEADSGIRLTPAATTLLGSPRSVTFGVRWFIDLQNGFDDGPFVATMACDPPRLLDAFEVEHELLGAEVTDFYRVESNTGTPAFATYSSTRALSGFADTGTPDRLVYASYNRSWSNGGWSYPVVEGDPLVDGDSGMSYTFGHDAADGILLAPGQSFRRSLVMSTSLEVMGCAAAADVQPGITRDASLVLCQGSCAEIGALVRDACGAGLATLVAASPGAPPCDGDPCTALLDVPGTHVYEWEATDPAGNVTRAVATVTVLTPEECATACFPAVTSPLRDAAACLGDSVTLDATGLTLTGCAATPAHEWRDGAGVVGRGSLLVVSPVDTTTYSVTVTCPADPACVFEDFATVTVDAPPLPGTVAVRDVATCNRGLEVTWTPATFRDPTASGAYNVYRSEVSCADALARPPLATGVDALRHFDATTETGRTYVYAVEAEDARAVTACVPAGADHGGASAVACSAAVEDAPGVPLPDGVYAVLRARHDDDLVTFTWSASRPLLAGEHFHLLKARLAANGSYERANPEADLSLSHAGVDTSAWLQFFDLRVANTCEELSLPEYLPGR